jgi:transcriptional regulator with PAS, ATPase and Fis domain
VGFALSLACIALSADSISEQARKLRKILLLRKEYSTRYGFPRIVGEHPSIREVGQQIQKVAATDSTCLLLGESGTGKEPGVRLCLRAALLRLSLLK